MNYFFPKNPSTTYVDRIGAKIYISEPELQDLLPKDVAAIMAPDLVATLAAAALATPTLATPTLAKTT